MTLDNPSLVRESAAGPAVAVPERRKGVVWKWSIAITVLVLGFLMWQCGSALLAGSKLSNSAVQQFHDEFNRSEYGQIIDAADEGFRTGMTRDELMRFLQAIHTRLGNAGQSNFTNVTVQANQEGTFLITVYQTKFDHGDAIETFTWIKGKGKLFLSGYKIRSSALVM